MKMTIAVRTSSTTLYDPIHIAANASAPTTTIKGSMPTFGSTA